MGGSDNNNNEIHFTEKDIKLLIGTTVTDTLTLLGVDYKEPLEMQKDFQHLRAWRESTEAIQRKGVLTLVAIFITSIIGAITLGAKEYFGS